MKNSDKNLAPEKENPIVLALGDDDELEFRPLTKGLGFHQNAKKTQAQVRTSTPGIMSRSLSSARPGTQKIPQVPALSSVPTHSLNAASSLPQELKAFYEAPAMGEEVLNKQTSQMRLETELSTKEMRTRAASWITQLGAWLVDMALILSFVATTMAALFFVLGLNFADWKEIILSDRNYVVPLCMFSIYYILYFGFLDLVGGPGKSLMGIRVTSRVKGEKLSFLKTSLRAVISLLSLAVFGLPHIVDFQGKLSDTEVVSE